MNAALSRPILLVEDDPELRTMLTTVLDLAGRAVITAANGKQALQFARQHSPSLIVLDLMMPIMTGEEFRHAQLADPEIRAIPVLVVSAHHDACNIARRMNASGCLLKPVDVHELSGWVERLAPRDASLRPT